MTSYRHPLDLVGNDVLTLARAMPADRYNFAPTPGVRTFAEQLKHLATIIFLTSAIVMEQRSPYAPGTNDNGPESLESKDEILLYLVESFAYARTAMDSLDESNYLTTVPTYFGPLPKAEVAAGIVYHSYNHYGQMVVYARMNGVVPPSSLT